MDAVSLAGVALLVICTIYFDGGLFLVIEKDTLRCPQQRLSLGFHPLL